MGALGYLLEKVGNEAARQAFAAEVMAKANSLLLNSYNTVDAAGEFGVHQNLGYISRYESSKESTIDGLRWLKTNLKDKEVEQSSGAELLARIEKNAKICWPLLSKVRDTSGSMSTSESIEQVKRFRSSVQSNLDQLIADLVQLVAYARKIQEESPRQEQLQRENMRNLLLALLGVNVFLSILAGLYFSSRIAGRVNSVVEDIDAFKQGMPLGEPMRGGDEIALVDSVFHEVAYRIAKEEEILKANEAKMRAIIDGLPLGLIILSESGMIEGLNEALERTFGYDTHELIGKRLSKLLAQSGATDSAALLDRLIEKSSRGSIELTARMKDGTTLPVEITMAEVNMGAGPRRLAIVVDATEQFEAKRLRQAFVSMVSRELKQPLTHVGAFLSGVRHGDFGHLSQKATDNAGKVEKNIARMIVLLNDLFDFEKLESGKIDVEPRISSLSSILSQVSNAVILFARKHDVEIEVPDVSAELYLDENRIIQVMINLISNAIKYSHKGSTVKVKVKCSQGELLVEVIDKGRGIPASHLNSVFDRFQQVETDDARKKGGTGLGLAVCKAIVDGHGGKIGVDSQLGKGSTFWFSIPVAQAVI